MQLLPFKDKDKEFVQVICNLIVNYGQSYGDLMGEEYEVKFDKEELKEKYGTIRIIRKGIPLAAMGIIIDFVNKQAKEQNRRLKKK